MDEAWGIWTRDNLTRGVARAILCDEMLIAGYEPGEVSALVREQFNAVRQSARQAAIKISLPTGVTHKTHIGCNCTVHEFQNFLSADECDYLIELAGSDLTPSTILGNDDPRHVRTSKTSQIGLLDDAVLESIDERIAGALGLPHAFSEPLQLHVYERNEFFLDHTDYLPESRIDAFDVAFGQRTYSILLYLCAPISGGCTVFPRAGISITPRVGSLLLWNNLDNDGFVNPSTLHRSEPVLNGEKVILTKWFRLPTGADGLWFPGEQVEEPAFKFRVTRMDDALLAQLQAELRGNRDLAKSETVPRIYLRSAAHGKEPSNIIPMSADSKAILVSHAAHLVTETTGKRMYEPVVYGIRQYNPGATLRLHFDRHDSHHAGVLYCIDRSNAQPWPLIVEAERGDLTEFEPSAGDAIVFAGASILHGRPRTLADGHVWNAFVHFRLEP